MSFMPPGENGIPPSPLTTGDAPTPAIDEAVAKAVAAMNAVADKAATAEDPEAVQRFGQGFFAFAQGVKELLTPPADPVGQQRLKAEADMVKAGAQLGHDEAKSEADRAAGNNGSKTAGGKDG